MNCRDIHDLLHPYADGELDLVRHLEIEQHLAECPQCAEQERSLRVLQTALQSPSLYHRAPASLRARVQRAAPAVAPRKRRRLWVPMAAAAAILLLVGTSATLGVLLFRSGRLTDEQLSEWVVAGHIRSLQVSHLTDVASSKTHEVKPWFLGQIDFSPPVPNLDQDDYKLTGGRLDYLARQPVAALVYHRRAHAINVFIWPADNADEKAVWKQTRQGYHVRHWQRAGMTYWVVSDLNDQELDDFVRLFQDKS
jgi:anti-sigma factor RsiW